MKWIHTSYSYSMAPNAPAVIQMAGINLLVELPSLQSNNDNLHDTEAEYDHLHRRHPYSYGGAKSLENKQTAGLLFLLKNLGIHKITSRVEWRQYRKHFLDFTVGIETKIPGGERGKKSELIQRISQVEYSQVTLVQQEVISLILLLA